MMCLHRLFCYPDEMYAYYPLRLTPAEEEGPQMGKRFEIGGMMRYPLTTHHLHEACFQRGFWLAPLSCARVGDG